MSNPVKARAPRVAAPTLEAPQVPARPMTSTPKQVHDVNEVARMLRESQPGRSLVDETPADDEEDAPEEDDPKEDAPKDSTLAMTAAIQEFGAPEWFKMPANGFPADVVPGTTVLFVRFPVSITGDPRKGERQCAIRPTTVKLEKYARSRAPSGSGYDLAEEYTKAMLCVIDGAQADFFSKHAGSVNHFWAEIGPKARELLHILYNKTHRLDAGARKDFLDNCVAVRTVG